MTRLTHLLGSRHPRNGAYLTVAIDGRGASGKSTLADRLAERLPGYVVLHGDDYFEPHDDPVTWGDFNEERFKAEFLTSLRAGDQELRWTPYDFPNDRLGTSQTLMLERGVILERWFSFGLPVEWDVRIWVETPAEECLRRGLARDGAAVLGDRARAAWQDVWQPRETAYIERTSPLQVADIVIDGTQPFADQLDEIT